MLRTLVCSSDTANEMRQRAVNSFLIEEPSTVRPPLLLRPCGHGRSKTVRRDLPAFLVNPSRITIALQSIEREMDGIATDTTMRPTPRENEAIVLPIDAGIVQLTQ